MGRVHIRLNKGRWRRVRWQVILRDRFTCQACGKIGGRLEVHHNPPMAKLDPLDPAAPYRLGGLELLCRGCHFIETQREQGQGPGPQGRREIADWTAHVKAFLNT